MKRPWSVLVAMLALCLALVGCGGGASSGGSGAQESPSVAEPDFGANFRGSWELVSMMDDGETSEVDLEQMKALGMYVYLDLNEDGSATLDVFGAPTDGTWEAQSENAATMTVNGEVANITLTDGLITMAQGSSSLTFKHIDPSQKVEQTPPEATNDSGAKYYGGDTIDDLDDAVEMNVGLVDDDICTMRVIAKGVYAGDPGFLFELTNKTDQDILFMSIRNWTAANGIEDDAILYETLHAGETLQSIMWFHADTIGTDDPGVLTDVKGTIILLDAADTTNEIARYEVSF